MEGAVYAGYHSNINHRIVERTDQPPEYLRQFVDLAIDKSFELHLSEDVAENAVNILLKFDEKYDHKLTTTKTFVAGAVYVSSVLANEKRTLKEVGKSLTVLHKQ